MKILVIRSSNPFARASASHNRFLTLVQGLVDKGCKIDMIFTTVIANKSELNKFRFSGVYDNINYQYLIPHDCTNFFKRQLYLKVLYRRHDLSRKLIPVITDSKYDFVWLDFSPQIVQLGLQIFKSEKTKDIKFFHERSEFSWITFKDNEKLHQQYLDSFLSQIDLMSVMTKTLEKYYKAYLNPAAKMIHLPMTVDLSRFENPNNNTSLNQPYIGYCGAMSNQKDGVDILIKSFLRIEDEFPELYLYLAGPQKPETDYLIQKEIIRNAQAKNRITYLGMIERDKMPDFLNNAKVLALARPESKQAEGGFPTKLGEYLATGNPVCVTKVGEIGDYLKDGESAYLAEPNSIESFASVLKLALTDPNAIYIGNRGKNIAYNYFNKEEQAKLLFEFLNVNKKN